jgi:peptide/nickel transport system ATP-binding protein
VTLLEIEDLRVRFGDRAVVAIDRLSMDEGEIVGLAGESGSGKSMTTLAVLGLTERAGASVHGSIRLRGLELIGLADQRLREIRGRRIAMIFQNPGGAFNPLFRVGNLFARALLLHGARSRREALERATEALRSVFLTPDLLERYPSQLSGGQLQRTAIAIALALRAELLLADEPTSALDVTVQAEVLELLRGVRDRGMGVLFISHDLAVVAELCDRVAVMRGGRIVEEGPTCRILAEPEHQYTQALIQAAPSLASAAGI